MKVLAIGAHPDDVELGCGGTLMKHVYAGSDVLIVVVTNGEAQKDVDWHKRIVEARKAAGLLGADMCTLGYEERNVCYQDHALVGKIRKVVEDYDANIVYGHSPHDDHVTHVAVAEATIAACKLVGVPCVYLFEVPSTRWNFVPSMLVVVTEHLDGKLAALECFVSQADRYYMLKEMISGLARTRAYEARLGPDAGGKLRAAEAFQVERMVLA